MPASQLKRLKASLREQGITGQQNAKKAKKRSVSSNGAGEQRARREAALSHIRESFNPFEVKAPTRPSKFDVTTNKTGRINGSKATVGRPGVTKSYGEQARRKTLLPELHSRNKVGGIVDRRIGENDPTMTPEERAERRLAGLSRRAKAGMFDLEQDDAEDELTHLGQSLMIEAGDDYDERASQASSDLEDEGLGLKRKRHTFPETDELSNEEAPEQPERKKSKAEIMKEVISKSKLHRFERQQAKEDDDDLREELDKGMGELMHVLRGHTGPKVAPTPTTDVESSINPDRLALLNGADRGLLDKDYDARIKQMTLDKRAQPTERTRTEEELAKEQADRLQDLEERRIRRMRGEPISDAEDESQHEDSHDVEDVEDDDAAAFGLSLPQEQRTVLDVEDEDDFIIDTDLVASGSDIDESNYSPDASEGPDDTDDVEILEEEDDELISGLLGKDERELLRQRQTSQSAKGGNFSSVSPVYSCPRSHPELLSMLNGVPITALPLSIQRIRATYTLEAAAENKEKLADFAAALVSHIVYLGDMTPEVPPSIIETVVRHVHSLSRTFADSISKAFQLELRALTNGELTPGRLCLLTAIGTIFPTSDHFHQVVTPAITLMARWLALTSPKTTRDFANGAYLGALCIKYQQLSRRYVPELLRFILHALSWPNPSPAILAAHLANLSAAMDIWAHKTAFVEIFSLHIQNALGRCRHQLASATLRKLQVLLQQSRQARRPLQLHRHRPLPIKTAIPLFEDNFNPDKHYDPNFARSESNKLKSEYKRERKGALRELRKDANFVARERLREKRERDRLHEEKERRIVAEINAEGGQERNEYERERKRRKAGR